MASDRAPERSNDKILTVQVFKDHLNPRTFKIPVTWFTRASLFAWGLLALSLVSSLYALKEYYSERSARPELVAELENEVQQLKIALEKKTESAPPPVIANKGEVPSDLKATDTKPLPGAGLALEGKEGVWGGLADKIAPPTGESTINLEDARLDWQGKFANFSAGVFFKNPGKGSQQGHIIVLGRGVNHITSHPDGVLNVSSGSALFSPDRGEYFSVSRFRPLKTHLGPYDSPSQLSEVQVFVFDLNNKLILVQTFKYGK